MNLLLCRLAAAPNDPAPPRPPRRGGCEQEIQFLFLSLCVWTSITVMDTVTQDTKELQITIPTNPTRGAGRDQKNNGRTQIPDHMRARPQTPDIPDTGGGETRHRDRAAEDLIFVGTGDVSRTQVAPSPSHRYAMDPCIFTIPRFKILAPPCITQRTEIDTHLLGGRG